MQLKLFAMDLDGTALNSDHLTISQENLDALREAAAQGILVVPSTGRALRRLPPFVAQLPEIRYAITSNGAAVTELTTGKRLYENLLAPDVSRRVFAAFRDMPLYMEVYMDSTCYTDHYRDTLFDKSGMTPGRRAMLTTHRVVVESLEALACSGQHSAEKINLPFIPEPLWEETHKRLDALPGVQITSSVAQNAEINAASCNKGSALAFLCRRLSISPDETLAMGDNNNDLEMLGFAGTAAVPENATPEAKRLADICTVTNDESAVARVLALLRGM